MLKSDSARKTLEILQERVVECKRCPRLIRYCQSVAQEKRRMFRDEIYWGRPLPSFGDPEGTLLILGLAPAAHGGNRTGRMFTGDRSGDFLYRALYESGFANQPRSVRRGDGLELRGCYITASLRCAPPENKPAPIELWRCRPYLIQELQLLRHIRAVLALGRIAFDTYLRVIYNSEAAQKRRSDTSPALVAEAAVAGNASLSPPPLPRRSHLRFAHGASYEFGGGHPRLFASYHPSQQNTQTGKLTLPMFLNVLEAVHNYLFAALPPAPEESKLEWE